MNPGGDGPRRRSNPSERRQGKDQMRTLFELAARGDKLGMTVTRLGLIVVLLWIGSLKAFRYEAVGIVPFVANSPAMSFLYKNPAPEYRRHVNKEGELVPANRAWHEANGTYLFRRLWPRRPSSWPTASHALPAPLAPPGEGAAVGSFLVFVMSLVTLSFLVTTPECWVPAARRFKPRVPVPERGRSAGRQGRDHDGRRPGHDGRLGAGLPAEAPGRSRPSAPEAEESPPRRRSGGVIRGSRKVNSPGAHQLGWIEALDAPVYRATDDRGTKT